MGFNPMALRAMKLYEGTPAEKSLEDAVAELGVPYRTQFPGYKYGTRYFPDFYLPTLKLVIEVDDDSHNKKDKIAADIERSAAIKAAWGATVVRCTNDEALDNPRGAVRAMLSSAGMWPLPSRCPTLRQALPALRKAPQKVKREAASAAKRAARTSKPVSAKRKPRADRGVVPPVRKSHPAEAPPPPLAPLP